MKLLSSLIFKYCKVLTFKYFYKLRTQFRLNNLFKYRAFNIGIKGNILCACDIKAIFILFFYHINTDRVFVGDDRDNVMFKLLWRWFICAFLMLWKVHRECCNSRNCNLGWADDCVPEITTVRLTDSSNSRYCVRHYGDVDTVVMFMAWESPSPHGYVSITLCQVLLFKRVSSFFNTWITLSITSWIFMLTN